MFCKKCGQYIPDDSNFCQYCGTKVVSQNSIKEDYTLFLTEDEVKRSITKEIQLEGVKEPIKVKIPSIIKDGQFIAIRTKISDANGKKTKKIITIKVRINAISQSEENS